MITLPVNDILYFEIPDTRKISIKTLTKEFQFNGRMAEIDDRLSDVGFLRIHQAYLINFDYIKTMDFKQVIMQDDRVFNVSGARRTEVRVQYMLLRQRKEESDWLPL